MTHADLTLHHGQRAFAVGRLVALQGSFWLDPLPRFADSQGHIFSHAAILLSTPVDPGKGTFKAIGVWYGHLQVEQFLTLTDPEPPARAPSPPVGALPERELYSLKIPKELERTMRGVTASRDTGSGRYLIIQVDAQTPEWQAFLDSFPSCPIALSPTILPL